MDSIVESSKVRIVEKLRAEAFQRYAYDEELESFEKELRRDLQQRGLQLSWDSARVDLEESQGINVAQDRFNGAPDARNARPCDSADPVNATPAQARFPVDDLPAAALQSGDRAEASVQCLEAPTPRGPDLQRPDAPTPRGRDHDDGDDFGEGGDDLPCLPTFSGMSPLGGSRASSRRSSGEVGSGPLTGAWHVRSQQPWQQGAEPCTLTILENACDELIQFDLLKHRTNAKMTLTCTHAQFDELCKEQTGLVGTAQVNAGIAQLFREAVEEIDKPRTLLDEDDDFGEDLGGEFSYLAAPAAEPQTGERWVIKSQLPWRHGMEHCTLTILENAVEGLVQFELIKNRTHTTMHVTCTNEQFDGLLKEQSGLSGAAQTNAAIAQLFLEAHDEMEQPACGLDPIDEFGMDSGDEAPQLERASSKDKAGEPDAAWRVKSQGPWQLGLEHCTLTILENAAEGLVQFELVKSSTNATMHLTCTNAQFDEILKEQTGLSGAAQSNAAISQLFQEAQAEIDKPEGALDPVDEFGEDFGAEFSAAATASAKWCVKSKQPWQLGRERCTLTILENRGEKLVQFELIKNINNSAMHVTCTNAQFDELLKEQSGLTGPPQLNAAIEQLFREAHEELERPAIGADAIDAFGEDLGAEFSYLAAPLAGRTTAAEWHVKSQQPFKVGAEHCTLTILENADETQVQFELRKHSTNGTINVTCTNQVFDGLLAEQSGVPGTATTNAAIEQLFREAQEEIDRPAEGEDADDDFGEDLGEEFSELAAPRPTAAPGAGRKRQSLLDTLLLQTEAEWHIASQQPWQLGQEHCTLTILENTAHTQVQFELRKHTTNTTMELTCTNEQFEGLLKEQAGLSGTARTNAAIEQLFREAHEEMNKPASGAQALDEFGEDFGQQFASERSANAAAGENRWHVKSQQPWQLGEQNCSLTILENTGENLIQFELLKHGTDETMYVTCTNDQFNNLLNEQAGLTGTAQVHAAIAQLFQEAHIEVEELDNFGGEADDFGEDAPKKVQEAESKWHVQSQQPWQFGQEHCTLTILENKGDGLLQFELLKHKTNTTIYAMGSSDQFDSLCEEQTGLSGTARINAAIAQLFREAHDEEVSAQAP